MENAAILESKVNSMAADLRLLVLPIRALLEIIAISAFILSFPALCFLLLMVLAFGSNIAAFLLHFAWFPPIWANMFILPAEDIWLLHLVVLILGPFASCFWFALIVRGYTFKREIGVWRFIRPFFHAGAAFIMSVVLGFFVWSLRPDASMLSASTEAGYLALAVGACFSPTLLFLLIRGLFY